MSSRVQGATGSAGATNTVSATLASAPTAGNLLVAVGYTSGQADQSASTCNNSMTQRVNTGTGNQASLIFAKIADGTESTTFTVTYNAAATGNCRLVVFEQEPTAGYEWVDPPVAETSGSTVVTAATATVTASGATAGRSFAVAAVGLGSNQTFGHTWTGGFTWDGLTTPNLISCATKDSTAPETFSTNETWAASTPARMVLAAFELTAAALAPPDDLSVVATSSTTAEGDFSDVSGAAGYDVEENGVVVLTDVALSEFSRTGLTPDTDYTYRVRPVSP